VIRPNLISLYKSEPFREILHIEGEVSMLLTAVLTPAPEGGYTAINPETGTTSQGQTIEEAVANLREATELYLEEFPLPSAGRSLIRTFEVTVNA
jgi:predicted RNase H-like HicB family nuclease